MKKTVMFGLAALMAVIGFVGSPAQAKEPSFKPQGDTAIEGRWGRPPPRRWHGPRGGYGWGPGWRYPPPRRRYYAPPRVIYAPPPVVYYGGSVGCY